MKTIEKIYNSKTYIITVVIIALVSLFEETEGYIEYSVLGLFIFDLIVGSILYIKFEKDKSIGHYFKHFTLDIIACIPIYGFGIFKIVRLIRIARLVKLRRLDEATTKVNFENLFSFNSLKQFTIYLLIYFIANVYLFEQIEHKSILDSVYWLVETITSVGYGDYTPTHTSTKLMGIFLMLIGIATIGYLNGVITSTVVRRLNHKDN